MPDQATTAVIAAGIAAFAALVSLLTLLFNVRSARRSSKSSANASAAADKSNQIAMGQAERGLRTGISEARDRYEEVSSQLEELVDGREPNDLSEREKRTARRMQARQRSAVENLTNAYEVACAQYVDQKVDRVRFKQTYFGEIRSLVEQPSLNRLLHPEGTSSFRAVWRVYREWYDLESNPPG